jgi:hypothetical protein
METELRLLRFLCAVEGMELWNNDGVYTDPLRYGTCLVGGFSNESHPCCWHYAVGGGTWHRGYGRCLFYLSAENVRAIDVRPGHLCSCGVRSGCLRACNVRSRNVQAKVWPVGQAKGSKGRQDLLCTRHLCTRDVRSGNVRSSGL